VETEKFKIFENQILPFFNLEDRISLRLSNKEIQNSIPKIKYHYFRNGRFDSIFGKIEMKNYVDAFPEDNLNSGFTFGISTNNGIGESTFSALKSNMTITWKNPKYFQILDFEKNKIKKIEVTRGAFAALTENSEVLTWGSPLSGSNPKPLIKDLISFHVKDITSTCGAFAALKTNDHIVVWGDSCFGGNYEQLLTLNPRNVKYIISTMGAFAALRYNGSVICWGAKGYGGNFLNISHQISHHIIKLEAISDFQFCATKQDGSKIIWPKHFDN